MVVVGNYDAKSLEPEVLKYWEAQQIYEKAKEKNKGKKQFYFLQGPPYTSGRLHIGHAWNNSMKDMILRFLRMQGLDVWDRAGYDMHGLPTEKAVQKLLNLNTKDDILRYGMDKFVKKCISFSSEMALQMDKDLWRLGVWMDYDNAYWPLKKTFMENEWWLIKKAHEQNRLYKGKKVMTWCSSCETGLAKHDLEYDNVKDDSIFLKFKVKDKPNEFLIVWTTTPWTIPFNMAIMVNPELEYVKASVENEVWIVAKALANVLISAVAGKQFKILEEFKGKKLEGTAYEHPLAKEIPFPKSKNLHTVILSEEYVDTSAGSGLVHCAPGCGPEDFEVGQKYGLPPFNNLNEQGIFFDMGKYTGMTAKKDDKKFIEEFKSFLIETTKVEHEYPMCSRCRNPVVFRATEQWFMKVEDLREKMIQENKSVGWVPQMGKEHYDAWIGSLKDNSITRQRFWGCPVPIWECAKCKKVTVVGDADELAKLATKPLPEDLHRPWIDAVKIKCTCGAEVSRIPDVIDVWIDSGTLGFNCIDYPKNKDTFNKIFPADLVLEATEQVRLWFSMLNICSFVALGRPSYKNVYMHGMILDYQGMKMSKSLGNVISPYEVVDKYGADVMRYYMCEVPAGKNINFNWDEVKQKNRNLTVLWNMHKLVIGLAKELSKNPELLDKKVVSSMYGDEEKYILSRLNSTIENVTKLFKEYHLDETITEIEKFFLELSRTYIQLVREKSAVGEEPEREVVLHTIYECMAKTIAMFSCIAPFISERIYLDFKDAFNIENLSVTLMSWPIADKKLINKDIEKGMQFAGNLIQSILAGRETAKLNVRWPLKAVHIVTENEGVHSAVEKLEQTIMNQANIKELHVHESFPEVKKTVKADPGKFGKAFGKDSPKITAKFAQESAENVLKQLTAHGKLSIEGKDITEDMLIIERSFPKHFVEVEFKEGFVYVDTTRTDELDAEGFARETMRAIQQQRKEVGLDKSQKIKIYIKSDEDTVEFLDSWKKKLQDKVGASSVTIGTQAPSANHKHSCSFEKGKRRIDFFFDVQ